MDSLNLLPAQTLMEERQRELAAITNAPTPAPARARRSMRHSLASTFVRLGLRLDPAAGEGVPAFDVTLGQERGC